MNLLEVDIVDDVIIAGGGATGLTLALCLRRLSGGLLNVRVLGASPEAPRTGPRTSALAEGPRHMLEHLGVWEQLAARAQPIWRMEISESAGDARLDQPLLTFARHPADAPLAHMVFHRDLEPLLLDAAKEAGVVFTADRVRHMSAGASLISVEGDSGTAYSGRLLVAADGARSQTRRLSGLRAYGWGYDRLALVATIAHERGHDGRATQAFHGAGPLAVLPVTGCRSSIVWTETTAAAQRLLALSTENFALELELRLDGRLGAVSVEEGPVAFPLAFQLAESFVGSRLALIGDAAHRVHPLAGQGLNLGLRDVATLAETILDQARLGLDPGSADVLEAYDRARRFDSVATSAAFDLMHRLFGMEGPMLQAAKAIGLRVTDRSTSLKSFFAREAAGAAGRAPQLFRRL